LVTVTVVTVVVFGDGVVTVVVYTVFTGATGSSVGATVQILVQQPVILSITAAKTEGMMK
jgi:predicted RNA-binding protein with TRAM domain